MDKKSKSFNDAPPEIKRIMRQVLDLEWEKLNDPRPKGIQGDILDIIKKEIQ